MKQYIQICIAMILLCSGFMQMQAQSLTKPAVESVLQEIISIIDDNYIIPEVKEKIVAGLRQHIKEGKYNQATDYKSLTKALNSDLRILSKDLHLYLDVKEDNNQKASTPRQQMMRSNPDPESFKGLLNSKLLDGNIAYLNVPMFAPLQYVKEDIDSFLQLSTNANALIIDVRQCPGGTGETLAYLAGGFVPDKTHLTTYYGVEGSTQLFSTETKYGPINKNKMVYVLIGSRTGSAAEGFAFYLQQQGRVTVVGKSSAGGGMSNRFFPIDDHLELSVSVRTSITPNGKQFQGVGVLPDVVTPENNALFQAHIQALTDLQMKFPDKKSYYEELIDEVGKPEVYPRRGDLRAIEQTVLGYLENFFENKTEAMFQYLHPQLAKRGISKKRGEPSLFFEDMTQEQLKEMLQKKRALSKEKQQHKVEILDVFHNTASVRVATGYPGRLEWIEYIHLCKLGEEWSIANIIWDYYPKKAKPLKHTK